MYLHQHYHCILSKYTFLYSTFFQLKPRDHAIRDHLTKKQNTEERQLLECWSCCTTAMLLSNNWTTYQDTLQDFGFYRNLYGIVCCCWGVQSKLSPLLPLDWRKIIFQRVFDLGLINRVRKYYNDPDRWTSRHYLQLPRQGGNYYIHAMCLWSLHILVSWRNVYPDGLRVCCKINSCTDPLKSLQ